MLLNAQSVKNAKEFGLAFFQAVVTLGEWGTTPNL